VMSGNVLHIVENGSTFDFQLDPTANFSGAKWRLTADGGASGVIGTNVSIDAPPTLSSMAPSVSFTPGQTVTLSPSATVLDPDDPTLASATVAITGGTFAGDGDVLGANVAGTGIAASYNSATETLVLSGRDTLAHYQQVLDSVTFQSGANPTNAGANRTRTVSWVLNDGLTASTAATTTITIAAKAANDFNRDHQTDLLFQNTGAADPLAGTPQIWLVNNTSVTSQTMLPNPGASWTIVGTGDFNNDVSTDLLLEDTSGNLAMWAMNGASVQTMSGLGNVGTNWKVIGIGDFNADSKADLLWETSTGDLAMWAMNGPTVQLAAGLGNVGTNWKVVGVGDFNADGKADLLWETGSGDLAMWQMNGPSVQQVTALGNVGTNWKIAGIGGFNGGGKADILWRGGRPHRGGGGGDTPPRHPGGPAGDTTGAAAA